ncbi:MAG TPA: hypothetical protein VFR74_08545 [Jiangellales bacterium]|nr:hypothetical protein [Jiangellales bacterium]
MDPFGTAALRDRVLAAWAASPARFREDANAEEDLARGSYRDRVVVELAQNAADAAARAGVPGRLLLRLRDGVLSAANTGAPLDAAGVEGLSTLRASAKREDDPAVTVGRFGVGFAAVLAVTDEPVVRSRTGAVRWSRREAGDLAAALPGLGEELTRRGEAVPVLRLPLPAADFVAPPPSPYDTEVVLPLRDEAAERLVRGLLDGIDDALLLTLPALAEVEVDVDGRARVLRAEERDGQGLVVVEGGRRTRWRLATRAGVADAELLADRPVEERLRPGWSVTVGVPVGEGGVPLPVPETVPRVVHAPTPTDESTALPALVVAAFPLDPSRRHVAPGALTDMLCAEVAAAYGELVAALAAAGPSALDLVPGPLPAGALDARLHEGVVAVLARTPLLPAADGSGALRPRDAVLVDGLRGAADPGALGRVVAGLPDPAWWRSDLLRRLGTRELRLVDVVDELAALAMRPSEWRTLYAALDGADRDALAALPVPLADGRLVRGPRGLLLPAGPLPPGLEALGLRVVDPEAAHPLLERLGAEEATAEALLRNPSFQAAVEAWPDDADADPGALGELVLAVVDGAFASVREQPWLGATPLPDAAGGWARADELLLPGSPVVGLLDAREDEVVSADAVDRWGANLLVRVGVREGFAVVRVEGVALEPDGLPDLDDVDGWLDACQDRLPPQDVPPVATELAAVADLELVRDQAWGPALELLAADPATREALVAPVRVVAGDGRSYDLPSYTAWWLREHARPGGRRLGDACAPGAHPAVRALLDPVPVTLDPVVLAALGLPRTVEDLLADPAGLLRRLADPEREPSAEATRAVYAGLATLDPRRVQPPERVRVPDGLGSRVVDAVDVVVADSPQWLQLGSDLVRLLPGPAALADVLDLPLAADELDHAVAGPGVAAPVPPAVREVVPGAPESYVEHEELLVGGRPVTWWVSGDGAVHAATLDGLARGVCWAAGAWDRRLLVAELVRDPGQAGELLAEEAWASSGAW